MPSLGLVLLTCMQKWTGTSRALKVGITVFIVPHKTQSRSTSKGQFQTVNTFVGSHLIPKTPYLYYAFGFKQRNNTIGFAFLVVYESQIVTGCQLMRMDSEEVFVLNVHAIMEAFSDIHLRGLGVLGIYSASRSALQALIAKCISKRSRY